MAKRHMFRGEKVVDANKDLEIHITKKDVTNSKKKDPTQCAAAQAILREQKCKEVAVFVSRTYVKEDDKWIRYMTPEAISREIVSFDRGAEFQPGEYRLNKPTGNQRLGVVTGGSGTQTAKPVRRMHMTTNIRDWKPTK